MKTWTEDLRLHVSELDEQHQAIFEVCRKLQNHREKTPGELQAEISFLAWYLDEHFAAEERLMASVSYGALADHAEEHARYRTSLGALLRRSREDASVVPELTDSVTTWLGYHIAQSDRGLAAVVQATHGAR